jgi:adenylate cyclase
MPAHLGFKPLKLLITAGIKLKDFFLPERGILKAAPYAIIVAAGIMVGILGVTTNLAHRLDWSLYDHYMKTASLGASPAPDIIIVAIDGLSFQEIGLRWPWPRSLHAALISALQNAGAQCIVFDLIFDRESQNPDEDYFLVQSVSDAGNVILASDRVETVDQAYAVTQWITPFPELAQAAAGTGIAKLILDPDGVIRRALLSFDGKPGLALAASLKRENFNPLYDLSGEKLIRFNGEPRTGIKTVSYYQALNPDEFLPEGIFKDKIVLVGLSLASAPEIEGAVDHYKTPVSDIMPGVEIHAHLLDTILRDRFIIDIFKTLFPAAVFYTLLALLVSPAFYRIGGFGGLLILLGSGIALFVAGYIGLAFLKLRIPVLSAFFILANVFLFTYLYRFILGKIERKLILGAFKHYLAPSIVESLLSDPSQLSLGGTEYEVTVLFTDLAGFTSISEKMSPDELQKLLKEYFQEMMDILTEENATLDKFIGDAIMVYFGCPVTDKNHPIQACRGAIKMQNRLQELNEKWSASKIPEIKMRVGINTGIVVAGNMGTEKIFNYTILGDSVNLSSRLEGVNKEYGTRTIISQFTRELTDDLFALRELDLIRVKGKTEPIAIFELADYSEALTDEEHKVFNLYEQGLSFYRNAQWDAAIEAFNKVLDINMNDGPGNTLLKRCYQYKKDPPPADWAGVHIMKTK